MDGLIKHPITSTNAPCPLTAKYVRGSSAAGTPTTPRIGTPASHSPTFTVNCPLRLMNSCQVSEKQVVAFSFVPSCEFAFRGWRGREGSIFIGLHGRSRITTRPSHRTLTMPGRRTGSGVLLPTTQDIGLHQARSAVGYSASRM